MNLKVNNSYAWLPEGGPPLLSTYANKLYWWARIRKSALAVFLFLQQFMMVLCRSIEVKIRFEFSFGECAAECSTRLGSVRGSVWSLSDPTPSAGRKTPSSVSQGPKVLGSNPTFSTTHITCLLNLPLADWNETETFFLSESIQAQQYYAPTSLSESPTQPQWESFQWNE